MLATARLQTIFCVSDLAAARIFYIDRLGLPIKREMFNGLVLDAGGSELLIAPVSDPTPSMHTAIGFIVAEVAAIVAEFAARGLTPYREPHIAYDETGIATAPDGSRVAWYRDPANNILSIVQYPAQA